MIRWAVHGQPKVFAWTKQASLASAPTPRGERKGKVTTDYGGQEGEVMLLCQFHLTFILKDCALSDLEQKFRS